MAAELPSVILLLRLLNWLICSHSSEKYFWIKILKPWPLRNMEVCLWKFNCSSYYLLKKLTCLPLPQRFQKVFSHKNKHKKLYLNTSTLYLNTYKLVCPQEESYTLLPTHSASQSSKRFKPPSVAILLWQGHCWIGKKTQTTNKYKLFMMLIKLYL